MCRYSVHTYSTPLHHTCHEHLHTLTWLRDTAWHPTIFLTSRSHGEFRTSDNCNCNTLSCVSRDVGAEAGIMFSILNIYSQVRNPIFLSLVIMCWSICNSNAHPRSRWIYLSSRHKVSWQETGGKILPYFLNFVVQFLFPKGCCTDTLCANMIKRHHVRYNLISNGKEQWQCGVRAY